MTNSLLFYGLQNNELEFSDNEFVLFSVRISVSGFGRVQPIPLPLLTASVPRSSRVWHWECQMRALSSDRSLTACHDKMLRVTLGHLQPHAWNQVFLQRHL